MGDIISIKGVTSYHPSTVETLDIAKQNIFVFGLNGAGKSTISDFLYNVERYPSCSIKIEGEYTPIVYNQTFIDENFLESSAQKGVFTLSKDNADLENRIFEKTQLRDRLREEYQKIDDKKTVVVNTKNDMETSTVDSVFEQKHAIEKTVLKPFLVGFKKPKSKFYNKVKSYSGALPTSISALCDEYLTLKKFDETAPVKISLPAPPQLSKESINQLLEPIVGSSNSQLSDFIKELGNMDWVKRGADSYLKNEQDYCPFCQSETINDKFRYELLSLFNKSYENNINKVKDIKELYQSSTAMYIKEINKSFTYCDLFDPEKYKIQPIIYDLEKVFQNNLKAIDLKIHNPSASVELAKHDEKVALLNELATKVNEAVSEMIEKIEKFKENEDDIRCRMWGSVRHNVNGILSQEKLFVEQKDKEVEILNKRLERIKGIGIKVNTRISTLRSKISNIDDTIVRINEGLKNLGVTSFEIIASSNPEQRNHFILSRGEEMSGKKEVFRSLSEGEKTLITFLYFIEKCNGGMSVDCGVVDKEKLIVIDDPISSLSQNYIYDVASIIQSRIIKGNKFKKVIVLTHSLFFFQELLRLAPSKTSDFNSKYALYRVSKNKHSNISSMLKEELKNDYQSLWQILKDVQNGKVNPVILPNIMRNILEYYFGFVHQKSKLRIILDDLAEQEQDQGFKAFFRYINRGSHSDPTNTGLMVKVDSEAYLKRFKKIFTATEDIEHYECMMG